MFYLIVPVINLTAYEFYKILLLPFSDQHLSPILYNFDPKTPYQHIAKDHTRYSLPPIMQPCSCISTTKFADFTKLKQSRAHHALSTFFYMTSLVNLRSWHQLKLPLPFGNQLVKMNDYSRSQRFKMFLNASKCSSSMRKFYSNNFATLYLCFLNTIRLSSSSSYLNILGRSPIWIFAYSSYSSCQSNDSTHQHCQTHWAPHTNSR